MPTFYAQKTTVQLSVADLGRATTPNPRVQQSLAATESVKNVAQEFSRGSMDGTLAETSLCTEEGSHVRFLGEHGNMPFFMVHAGKNFFDMTTKEKRNRRPASIPFAGKTEGESTSTAVDLDGGKISTGTIKDSNIEPNPKYRPPLVPHALCLTVLLSNSSFAGIKNMVTAKPEINDVKIDVYFNGALCGSHYVPRRYSGGAYTLSEHIVRFTGCRIGRLIEKPWVIVPSGQNPDGSLREHRRGKVAYSGAQGRWNDISDALMAEADKFGHDEKGKRPVIGEYLESLAQLSMPKDVEDMQRAGSAKFALLDVVVIWGKGNKHGPDAPYITEPTSISIEGFTSTNLDQPMDHSLVQNAAKNPESTCTAPQSRSEALANARSIDYYPDIPPQSVTPPPGPILNDETNPAASSPLDQPSYSALPFEIPVKRSRGPYHDILTTKLTLCEEMDSIAAAASGTNARTTRASYASAADSSPLSAAPMTIDQTPAQTKIVKFKVPSSANPPTTPGVMGTPYAPDEEVDGDFLTPVKRRTSAPESKRRERASTQLGADALDWGFVTPALSVDCSATYASKGIVRNVGAARGGVFKEGGVVMGARFVIGG